MIDFWKKSVFFHPMEQLTPFSQPLPPKGQWLGGRLSEFRRPATVCYTGPPPPKFRGRTTAPGRAAEGDELPGKKCDLAASAISVRH